MLKESISDYKDECSEARPTHVALWAGCIRRGKVTQ